MLVCHYLCSICLVHTATPDFLINCLVLQPTLLCVGGVALDLPYQCAAGSLQGDSLLFCDMGLKVPCRMVQCQVPYGAELVSAVKLSLKRCLLETRGFGDHCSF